jgi:hypothetical protein
MAWNWFWLQVPPSKVDTEVKAQNARQEPTLGSGKPFEGAPPPFLNIEHEKRERPPRAN